MLRLVVTILAALSATVAATVADTPVERGAYLVNAVMACDGCHTPRPPGAGFDMGKRFSGGSQTWDTPRYLVKGSNISPDSETGIGKWSDADFKRALTEGVRPSGVSLVPQMPFVFYKVPVRPPTRRRMDRAGSCRAPSARGLPAPAPTPGAGTARSAGTGVPGAEPC